MRKQPSFVRMTISISGNLKARMDKAKEPVNWSAIAGHAFEEKLAEIAMRKEKKDMTEVVSRLRASLRKNELQSFRDGYAAGTEWAKNRAEAMQLKRLHDWRKEIQTGEKIPLNEFFIPSQPSVISLLTAKKIVGNQNFGQEAAEAFWENALGKDSCHQLDRDFLRGFVEGAADIWASVRRQVTIIDGRPDQED